MGVYIEKIAVIGRIYQGSFYGKVWMLTFLGCLACAVKY